MQQIEQKNRVVDALRMTEQDLSAAIDNARRKLRRGIRIQGGSYLRQLREFHELQEKAFALGARGGLVGPQMPIPHRQPVGVSADLRMAEEWKWVFDDFPFPASIPSHYRIAAE